MAIHGDYSKGGGLGDDQDDPHLNHWYGGPTTSSLGATIIVAIVIIVGLFALAAIFGV